MRYEAIPSRLIAYGIPQIAPEEDFASPKHVRVEGVTTLPTTVEDAEQRTDDRIRYVRSRLRRGDHQALVDLLYDYPGFIADSWVRKELLKWLATGRAYQNRGRKMGSFIRHPMIIVSVVEELLIRGCVPSKAAAFRWLEERAWLSATAVRDSYYQALSDDRFKAVLIQDPSQEKSITEKEFNEAARCGEMLLPGKTITRTLATFPEGSMSLTLEGL